VLAGILAGLLAASLQRRCRHASAATVPTLTAMVAVAGGLVFGLAWYWPEMGLAHIARLAVIHGAWGAAANATLNRLLLPLGLHHVTNNVVWYELGDLSRFAATAGREGGVFAAGFFPTMMFGLPGAALAILRTARPERRRIVGGILLSGAVTSFLTGVTEPVEFAFMFVAPILYLLHAVFAGVGAFLAVLVGAREGFSFSAGLVDYWLNYDLATRPLALLAVGIGMGVVYYASFVTIIRALDLPTPGRESPPA
jgi:PTS system N-acetylglucosamine-specific IIC component